MLNNKIKIVFLFLLMISCKKNLSNNHKFIESLSDDIDFNLPMVNESLIIFVCKNDIIYGTSLRELYSIKEDMEIKNFDYFLIEVINNNLLPENELKNNSTFFFSPNKEVLKKFKKKGIEYLIHIYCDTSNTMGKYYVKSNLDLNTKQTVMYIFFKNNYYIMEDDYSGKCVMIDKNL